MSSPCVCVVCLSTFRLSTVAPFVSARHPRLNRWQSRNHRAYMFVWPITSHCSAPGKSTIALSLDQCIDIQMGLYWNWPMFASPHFTQPKLHKGRLSTGISSANSQHQPTSRLVQSFNWLHIVDVLGRRKWLARLRQKCCLLPLSPRLPSLNGANCPLFS